MPLIPDGWKDVAATWLLSDIPGTKNGVPARSNMGCSPTRKAIRVFEGNASDAKSFIDAIGVVTESFGLTELAMVGDRGMITNELRS
jgi:hypothetical protein